MSVHQFTTTLREVNVNLQKSHEFCSKVALKSGVELMQCIGMSTFGKAIRLARDSKKYSQAELANLAGVTAGTVNNVENGHTEPRRKTIISIVRALGYATYEQLAKDVEVFRVRQQIGDPYGGIPILSEVPAGNGDDEPDYDQGVGEGYINREAVGIEDPLAYGLRVRGDSMMPFANNGEIVICSPTDVDKNGFVDGEVYAIRFTEDLDNDCTVKRVRFVGDGAEEIELVPDNPRHATRRVRLEHIARAACVASVMRLNSRFTKH